jgi:uncharacterized repeat protein (TIGR02543 family)
VSNSTVSNNMATELVGGIGNDGGTLTVTNSIVSGNSGFQGGGIDNASGLLTVTNSTISGNTSSGGGGIYNTYGNTATVSNSTLSGNTAIEGGGIDNQGTLTVTNSTLSGNWGTEGGGGIYNGGTLTVSSSTLSGNYVSNAGSGGGIFSGGTLTVSNSTLSGNYLTANNYFGSGIWNNGPATVSYSTLSGNYSTANSTTTAAIYNGRSQSTLTLKGTLLAGNAGSGVNCSGITTSDGYNLDDDGSCGLSQNGDQSGVTGAKSYLGVLAGNGGPTQTMALLAGSPAIDAIPVNECTDALGNPVATDQRGITRPQGSGCDIGAYELAQPAVTANVCFGTHTPAPCSDTFTLDYYVPSGTTLGANPVQVVTQGTTGLDFTLASTTCDSSLSGPANCTVQISFAPRAPGVRMGAVNLINSSGSPFASNLISGTAAGSGLAFTPGIIATVAGNGTNSSISYSGPATGAHLGSPVGGAVDSAGNLYIADDVTGTVRKVNAGGIISTVAGGGSGCAGQTDSQEDGCPATSVELDNPQGLAVDGAGNLYIENNHLIRKVNASGVISTVAGGGSGCPAQTDSLGDGCPAINATFSEPIGIAVDSAGNLYIADTGDNVIRKVNAAAIISTVAGNGTAGYSGDNGPATSAQLLQPTYVAADSAGNLYITDANNHLSLLLSNNVIRRVNPSGIITTVAGNGTPGYSGDGGPATSAQLQGPGGVAVDSAGNLYIADAYNSAIRKVNAGGIITTVAGTPGSFSYTGDNGPATSAHLNTPQDVKVDSAGNLYIVDMDDGAIRKVTVTSALLSFSSLNVGQTSSPQSVVVSDVGNAPLNFSPFTISSNFKLATVSDGCAAGTPLASGYDCDLGAEFAPLAPGNPLTGSITVADDAFTTPQSVSLSGIAAGVTQYMLTTAVSPAGGGTVTPPTGNQNANAVVNLKAVPNAGYVFLGWTGSAVANAASASTTITMTGPESVTANFVSTLSVAPSTIAFGTVYLATLTTKDITLTNNGTTAITITDPLLSIVQGGNSFEFVAVNGCPKSLAAGSHCTISITFVAGPFYTPQTATLSIADNAPGNPQKVTLSATVIDPQASFNPISLSFGDQTVNTSATKTITLKNVGATALLLNGMTVMGTNAGQFTLTPASNCGSSVSPGGSCTISVTFKPVAKVSYSATLKVTDNTQSGTQTVALSGTGH